MKHRFWFFPLIIFSIIIFSGYSDGVHKNIGKKINISANLLNATDTCIIEGLTFKMMDYKSNRKLKAYIKNSQLYVETKGLQYAKFRIIYYIFSSLDDENMPSVRHFDQRLSPPVLQILKNAAVGNQFLFEEITVVDGSNKELTNAVKPLLIERVKN